MRESPRQRIRNAVSEINWLNGEISFMEKELSNLRKMRRQNRMKLERAEKALAKQPEE